MVRGAGSIRVAPHASATIICSIEVSKASEASCTTRSRAQIRYSRASSVMTQAREPWLTAIALGVPVEPEVWMT